MANGVLGRWCGAVDSGAAINALAAGVSGFRWRKQAAPPLRALFAPRNGNPATLLLWLCYFFTLLVVLYVDQLATATFGGARIPAIAGGRGDVCPANGGGKRTLMLGALMDKLRPVTMSLLIYSGMLASAAGAWNGVVI